jgi:hypothetical protein
MVSLPSRLNCIIRRVEYEFARVFEDIEYDRYIYSFYIRHPRLTNYYLKVSVVDYEEYCRIILYREFSIDDDEEEDEDEDEGEIIGIGILIPNTITLHTYINWFLSITIPPLDLPRSLDIPEEDNSDDDSNYNSVGESEEE